MQQKHHTCIQKVLGVAFGSSCVETTLIYAHADTEIKRQAIEKAIPDDSELKHFLNAERYTISDEELLKQLCGLK